MSYSSYEKAVRALVEGGLRMINNMIPDVPAGAARQRVRIEPVSQPSSQLRLPLTQPGRGAQTYSPAKSAGPGTAETIQAGQRALPAESSAQRGQRLLQEAQESRLLMTPRGGVGAAARGNLPPFAAEVFERARIPRTVPVQPSRQILSPQAPVPAWAKAEQLRISDPEVYSAVRSIAESTARERGVQADDVMRALLSPEGTESELLRQLAAPSEIVPPGGGGLIPPGGGGVSGGRGGALTTTSTGRPATQDIVPVNVYEVLRQQNLIPETAAPGGVQTLDLNRALNAPGFVDAMGEQLLELAGGPAAAAARGGQEAAAAMSRSGSRIPLAPVVGVGALGGLGIAALLGNRQNELPGAIEPAPVPGQTPLGVPTATPAGANTPAVTGAPVTTPAAPIAGSTNAIPGTANPSSLTPATAPAVRPGPPIAPAPAAPVVSAAGAGSVVQQRNDGDSNYRQAVQNAAQALRQDASSYGPGQIGAFYAAQEAYANAPGRAEQIIGALRQAGAPSSIGMESDAAFKAWATANPELAYRLQLQMQPRGANQQMPVAQGSVIGTSVGTNFTNNALGQSRAAAVNAAYGTQGSADLADALKPQSYATLQAPRSAMYAGYSR